METFKTTPTVSKITGTKKRSFFLSISNGREISTSVYWSGGSRDAFSVLNIETKKIKIPPTGSYPNFKAGYTLEENEILIKTGIFCGKPATVNITCRDEDKDKVMKFLGIK